MDKLTSYIKEVLGYKIFLEKMEAKELNQLPYFIRESYRFHRAVAKDNHGDFIIAESKPQSKPTVRQVEKQLQTVKELTQKKVVFAANQITALNRKRFIEKGINFIIPGKQMFLPEMMIDLKEVYRKPAKEKLLPSAQFIMLYHILHRTGKIENLSLKQLAEKFGYTPMAITKAADNLRHLELCELQGTKEKSIRFPQPVPELWHQALPLITSPVLKQVYVDELPENIFLMKSNESALPEYTEMAESRQKYFAMEKRMFYSLKKEDNLKTLNDYEGNYCLEIWKYNPEKLAEGVTEEINVDPLSLYLSMKHMQDERIEIALEQIIEKYIW